MLRRTLTTLFAILIAACPVTCLVIAQTSRDCRCEAEDASPLPGCEKCRAQAAQNGAGKQGRDAPVPCCPCQEKGQNCICSGAVIDADDGYEVELPPSLDLLANLSPNMLAITRAFGDSSLENGHLYVISGRDMRALISSFLC